MINELKSYLFETYNYLSKTSSNKNYKLHLIKCLSSYGIDFIRNKSIGKSLGLYFSFPKPLIIKTWDNFYFYVRPNTSDLPLATLIREKYELENWFYPNIKGTFVDVGANVGGYSIRASKFCKKVIAIEPLKECTEVLKINAKLNKCKNLKIIEIAVGDKNEKLEIRYSKDYGKASLISNSEENKKS